MAIVGLLLLPIVYFGTPLLNSQARNLRAIEAHIRKITPEWNKFRAEHRGFDEVQLFAYTGDDGLFAVAGFVATDEQVTQLRKFMESTAPPRPTYLVPVHVVGQEFFDLQKAANNSIVANAGNPATDKR